MSETFSNYLNTKLNKTLKDSRLEILNIVHYENCDYSFHNSVSIIFHIWNNFSDKIKRAK